MSDDTNSEFDCWAVLELMGHRRAVGHADPPITQYYGAEAVYCMTPVTEEAAQRAAQITRPMLPVGLTVIDDDDYVEEYDDTSGIEDVVTTGDRL